jgi:hypothetical protein
MELAFLIGLPVTMRPFESVKESVYTSVLWSLITWPLMVSSFISMGIFT